MEVEHKRVVESKLGVKNPFVILVFTLSIWPSEPGKAVHAG